MWKWAQGAVASVTGAAEPEYGAEAFHSIDKTVAGQNPFGELTAKDYLWVQPPQSHVETQTFYFHSDEYFGFAQLIHSNPVNLAYTSQFTFLLRKTDDPDFRVWGSHRLDQAEVTGDGYDFKAENFRISLNKERTAYKFNGLCGEDIQVDLEFKRVADGFKIGKDGFSKYGTDPNNPWGTMRHIFWPRCDVTGIIVVKSKSLLLDVSENGRGLFVMALQGMKPHHLAARWNFLDFQGPTVSVTAMEFTTPPSYGCQKSSIGAVVKDGKLLMTAVNVDIRHTATQQDDKEDANWPMPTSIQFVLEGPQPNGDLAKPVKVEVSGDLPILADRVDVMSELPSFVKRVASGLSGARPIIYQFYNELTAKITVNGETHEEKGRAFNEATFISEI